MLSSIVQTIMPLLPVEKISTGIDPKPSFFFFTEIMIGAIMDAHALFPALGEQASRRASEQAKKV